MTRVGWRIRGEREALGRGGAQAGSQTDVAWQSVCVAAVPKQR